MEWPSTKAWLQGACIPGNLQRNDGDEEDTPEVYWARPGRSLGLHYMLICTNPHRIMREVPSGSPCYPPGSEAPTAELIHLESKWLAGTGPGPLAPEFMLPTMLQCCLPNQQTIWDWSTKERQTRKLGSEGTGDRSKAKVSIRYFSEHFVILLLIPFSPFPPPLPTFCSPHSLPH